MRESEAVLVPDGRTHFQLGERSFSIDLVEAIVEIERIEAKYAGWADGGMPWLKDFRQWVHGQTANEAAPMNGAAELPGVLLSLAQADWLFDQVRLIYAREKKERLASLDLSPPG